VKRKPVGIQERLVALARQYNLVAVYAFGSRAGEIAARVAGRDVESVYTASDVDIGVLPVPGHVLAPLDRVRLTFALEELLNVRQVDLVVLPEAPPYLALDIVKGELLSTTNPDTEAEHQLYVLRRAGDLASFERERLRVILMGEGI